MEMSFRLGKFSLPARLTLFASAAVLGFALQIALAAGGTSFPAAFIPGALVTAAGGLVLTARSYSNKPADLGYEEWEPASEAEVNRIGTNFLLTKKISLPAYFTVGFGVFALILLAAAGIVLLLVGGNPPAAIVALDAAVLLYPVLLSGSVHLFVPRELEMKLRTFMPVIEADRPDSIRMTPYLRLDRDAEGRRIPEDIRLMVEPKRKPEDLVGAQIQVAINKGPNGQVPYMYAVFLTKGTGKSWERLSRVSFPGFVVERERDPEYSTVVVRQETSGTGYHTTERDCLRLYGTVLESLELFSGAS